MNQEFPVQHMRERTVQDKTTDKNESGLSSAKHKR